MRDAGGKVIYVGKAKNLRQRLRSYYTDTGDNRLLAQVLRRQMAAIETILTTTEKEALLLENTLIKEHRPRFNIRLRDDKTYPSLRLDLGHEWPRLHRIRRRLAGDRSALYFGPFVSPAALRETQRFLLSLYPLRSCSDSILANRSRPCLLHQIGRCCAPCVNKVERDEYARMVESTRLFLQGRREDVLRLLREKMEECSEAMQFEKAAGIRDRLRALEETMERERVVSHRAFDRDVVAFVRERGRAVFAVLMFRDGKLKEGRNFDLRDPDIDDDALLEQFLSQYYGERPGIPRDILTQCEPANADLVRQALEEQRGGPIRLRAPQRGEKLRLVEMAARNARARLDQVLAGGRDDQEAAAGLAARLGLAAPPRHIECFDISNIQGTMAVGSMSCFQDGQPDKAGYRHFVIRSVEGANDFAMMREVIERRYRRALAENRPLPDLVLIDGGRGQLGVAQEVFGELGLAGRGVALAAIAKSRPIAPSGGSQTEPRRTDERIFLPGRKNPVIFRRNDPALFLLQRARDEAHRFGVAFHRRLRGSASLRSALDALPGIGPTRRRAILRHFGSIARLREATLEEIRAVPRLPAQVAETIHRFLHPAQTELFASDTPSPGEADASTASLWDHEEEEFGAEQAGEKDLVENSADGSSLEDDEDDLFADQGNADSEYCHKKYERLESDEEQPENGG